MLFFESFLVGFKFNKPDMYLPLCMRMRNIFCSFFWYLFCFEIFERKFKNVVHIEIIQFDYWHLFRLFDRLTSSRHCNYILNEFLIYETQIKLHETFECNEFYNHFATLLGPENHLKNTK